MMKQQKWTMTFNANEKEAMNKLISILVKDGVNFKVEKVFLTGKRILTFRYPKRKYESMLACIRQCFN